jgi:thymidine phosphorylase
LGGGRQRQGDALDLSVGLDQMAGLGTHVTKGDPIAIVHAADEAALERAKMAVLAAYEIGALVTDEHALIVKRIG